MSRRVLITRAAEDAAPLASALVRLGYEPVIVPLIERRWHVDSVADFARRHPTPRIVLVTSGVVARILATAAPNAWRDAMWVAVGRSTRARLEQVGLPCHLVPSTHTAADMVHAVSTELGDALRGAQVVYPRADLASQETRDSLVALGAKVDDVVAYTNQTPAGALDHLRAALPVDATPVLSGSAGRRLVQLVDDDVGPLGRVIAIGPSTAAVCREVGLPVHAQATPHNLHGVLLAIHSLVPAT